MPLALDQASLENLQAAFREVALRAERLQEWVALNEKYRVLDRSTSGFGSAAKAQTVDWPRLEEAWHVVQVDDLPAVSDYIATMSKVRTPLAGEPAGSPGSAATRVDEWRAGLTALATEVDKAVVDQSPPQIEKSSRKITDLVRSQINQLKEIIDRDIKALCLQTQLLRQKIEG